MGVRVLLAGQDDAFRRALAQRLAAVGNIDVVASARDGDEAVELYRKLPLDVVLMDVGMPGCGGIEATRRIVAVDADARIIALAGDEDHRALEQCLGAGARGCLKKGHDTVGLAVLMVALAIAPARREDAPGPARAHTWKLAPRRLALRWGARGLTAGA